MLTDSQNACMFREHGTVFRMARQPRFEYAGAVYHVMARGNGGDDVFVTGDDRKSFLFRLGQVCAIQNPFDDPFDFNCPSGQCLLAGTGTA